MQPCAQKTSESDRRRRLRQVFEASARAWAEQWRSGAALDLAGSTAAGAAELERRVVLSQCTAGLGVQGRPKLFLGPQNYSVHESTVQNSSRARADSLAGPNRARRYIMMSQEAGSNPPQETGLMTNSWYGKFHCPGPAGRLAPLAFSYVNRFSMVLLYGRAGRLNTKNAGFRPGQWRCAGTTASTSRSGGAASRGR
jgi:hypothetical protein